MMKTKMNYSRLTMLIVSFLIITACGNMQKNTGDNNNQSDKKASVPEPPDTNIHTAAFMGDLKAIQQHIKAGTDLNQKDAYGSTPLVIATTFGKTEVAIALIEGGADMNISNNDGSTVLHTAAFLCRTEIMKALLDHGIDTSIKNNYGSSALESVQVPFKDVIPIYDQFSKNLGPLGLKLNYDRIERTRPVIAEMLKKAE